MRPLKTLPVRSLFSHLLLLLLVGCASPPVPARLQFLGYQGYVNEHKILIHAPISRVFALLTDHDRLQELAPVDLVQSTKVSPGPYSVGTLIHSETRYKIKLQWDSRVVRLEQDHLLVLEFLNGIFRGGYEVWELQPEGDFALLSHTLVYNLANPLYHILWVVKQGETKHDALVETTLLNIKRASEMEMMPSPRGPDAEGPES